MVSFLGRVNQNKNLEILQPHLEQDLVEWIGNHEDYIEFKFIEKEMVSEVFDVFNTYKNTILENADKIVNQEYSSLKLEQQARTFAALLKKTVDINNVKLFYSSEQNRTAFAYGFSFIDAELMDFAASINPDDLVDKPNLSSPIIPTAVEENEFPALVTPLPPNVKKNRNNKHPWWINTIRSINWFAWKYWWLVWLLFILSFLLLYFFCPSKKKTSNSTCNELNHIHKNIDTLNGGLLYCCDCNISSPPDVIKKDSTAVDSTAVDSTAVDCPDRILAFQVCNSNSDRDDDFDVILNGVKIGELHLNTDAKVGSVFLATTNRSISIERADFTCPIANMEIYYFDPSIVRFGTNILFLKNIKNNANSNAGSIEIRNYLLKDNKLVDPCRVKDLPFRFESGLDFKIEFEYTKCCENTP